MTVYFTDGSFETFDVGDAPMEEAVAVGDSGSLVLRDNSGVEVTVIAFGQWKYVVYSKDAA